MDLPNANRKQARMFLTKCFILVKNIVFPWPIISNNAFIHSLKVCQGPYDPVLVKAWEDWDDKHGSENDHPKQFPETQVNSFISLMFVCEYSL